MFGINWRGTATRAFFTTFLILTVAFGITGCQDRFETPSIGTQGEATTQLSKKLSEVSPPPELVKLRDSLKNYRPQVTIVSPRANEVLQDTTVNVRFQVQDLPIFKNSDLELGPHLHVILDNQRDIEVYDITQPLVFQDLEPGSHTLRVFAARPWDESFKNEGAYAQTTFHVLTKTEANQPDPALPLLTYNRPVNTYGAEPILLDFYLSNAPLHLVAQANPDDNISDWRIRVTINGESFVLDQWEPIYLKGFKPGKNWVQLEFLNEQGNALKNVFNNTVRLMTYEPNGQDTLSKLVRGELSAEQALGIVDPSYAPPPEPTIVPELETPAPTLEEEVPLAEPMPSEVETPAAEPSISEPATETLQKPEVTPEVKPTPEPISTPDVLPTPTPSPELMPAELLNEAEPTAIDETATEVPVQPEDSLAD